MRLRLMPTPRIALFSVLLLAALAVPAAQPARRIAVTIDDGPFVNARRVEWLRNAEAGTTRLLAALRRHSATATLFVNERQLQDGGPSEVTARTALLRRWVEDGHALGNHTYAHVDASALTADAFTADVARGDEVSFRLMAPRGAYQRFFRHPYTHTGETPEKKGAIGRFLGARGYTITPHTIENADWQFNHPFVRAVDAGDSAAEEKVADAYLTHSLEAVAFAEGASRRVFGREIPQLLLIHTNHVNAALLDTLLGRIAARGYRFVPLDEVMKDDAYRTPDTWVGRGGPTWLFRWSRSLGQTVSFAGEPEPPAWIADPPPAPSREGKRQ